MINLSILICQTLTTAIIAGTSITLSSTWYQQLSWFCAMVIGGTIITVINMLLISGPVVDRYVNGAWKWNTLEVWGDHPDGDILFTSGNLTIGMLIIPITLLSVL